MNDQQHHNESPWPSGSTPEQERELAAGWQALDRALSGIESSLDRRPLSSARLTMLAAQVNRQVQAERRRRSRVMALAASLLVGLGLMAWSLMNELPRGQQQLAHAPVAAPSAETTPSNTSPAVTQVSSTWNDDDWLADVSNTRRSVEAVESDWTGNLQSWSEVQEGLDQLESELSNESPL